MRELKFRGINLDTNEWVYGYGVVQNIEHNEARIINSTGGNMMHNWDVKPETVGQFTGMNDQHDVEIYEGDIVSTVQNSLHNRLIKPTVSFEEGSFVVMDSKYSYEYLHYYETDTQIEIIDNIHQSSTEASSC